MLQDENGQLFRLVTKRPPDPHLWPRCEEYVSRPADAALGRHQQTERTCPKCKLVKITVHPPQGDGWREWRWGDAPTQFRDDVMPECVRIEDVIEKARAS